MLIETVLKIITIKKIMAKYTILFKAESDKNINLYAVRLASKVPQ